MKILFVCLGNICRSPLAEGIFRYINADIEVDSAGTSNYHIGRSPDTRMIDTAHSFGIDISNFSAKQFIYKYFKKFDRIYVMDSENYKDLLSLAKNDDDKSKVYFTFKNKKDVPDPYFGGSEGFINVYNLLYEACKNINNEIKNS